MKYHTLPPEVSTRQIIDNFRGYNHNLKIPAGEFYDMENMTSDYYPMLSPRRTRGTYRDSGNINGIIAKDKLCYVDGAEMVIGDDRIDMGFSDGDKVLVSMGAHIVIMPDKKYINTADYNDRGNIEPAFIHSDSFSISLCDPVNYQTLRPQRSETPPASPEHGDVYIDISRVPHVVMKYSTNDGRWVEVQACLRIELPNKEKTLPLLEFKAGELIELSGLTGNYYHETMEPDEAEPMCQMISELNNTPMVVKAVRRGTRVDGWHRDYLVVEGMIDEYYEQAGGLTIAKPMPKMDFIIESGNRLWGCRYGNNNYGNFVNEIYASALGDFKSWETFKGISTDSYTASVGTDGEFTGAATYMGNPIFFKENCMHKVYGNFPANFQIQDTACRGVQKGSFRSLAIVNEVLYYKSALGVCAYDGSLPVEISAPLGEVRYSSAVGGAHGNKYYISMKDSGNKYHLFAFDTVKGMWHREDNTEADYFCSYGNEMYYVDRNIGGIRTLFGSGELDHEPINWSVETGVVGFDSPDKKYVSNLTVRLSLEFGSHVYFYIQYDSSGIWERICTMSGHKLRTFNVPIRPHRCDHFRLRIAGEGHSKIYSIVKTLEDGSEI